MKMFLKTAALLAALGGIWWVSVDWKIRDTRDQVEARMQVNLLKEQLKEKDKQIEELTSNIQYRSASTAICEMASKEKDLTIEKFRKIIYEQQVIMKRDSAILFGGGRK
jgi:hypothetical protein